MRKTPRLRTDAPLDWSPYPGNRQAARHPAGFLVIVPLDYEDPTPLFCPVCGCSQPTQEDVQTCMAEGCCAHCYQKWAYSHREEWKKGWRPTVSSCDYKKTITVGQ